MTESLQEWISRARFGPIPHRIAALQALAGQTDREALRILAESTFDPDRRISEAAQEALYLSAVAYTKYLTPSFHILPWHPNVLDDRQFRTVYDEVVRRTEGFRRVSPDELADLLRQYPKAVLVLQQIVGYTEQELAFAINLIGIDAEGQPIKVTKSVIERMQRGQLTRKARRIVPLLARIFFEIVTRQRFDIPEELDPTVYRSRMDKPDTGDGWASVQQIAEKGLSYADLLYQRYVGGSFRQVMDRGAGLKRDLVEKAVERFLQAKRISHYKEQPGDVLGEIQPAPDFLIPDKADPRVVIECSLAADGGTAYKKADRIAGMAVVTQRLGITLIAVIDDKGYLRIRDALQKVIASTRGLTFTLSNLEEIAELPEMKPFIGIS